MENQQKQLKPDSTIICDVEDCKAEFKHKDVEVKYQRVNEPGAELGLKRSYFCCPKCGHKYTIDVTDLALRLKIKEFKTLVRKQRRLMSKGVGEQRIRNNMVKLESLKNEIVARSAELKRKWK